MLTRIILSGRVQGVGCRGYCASCARKLNIRGSASNMRDGTVSVILETDNRETVKGYIETLLNNPYGFYFHGRINSYTIEDYKGAPAGDYRF